VVAFETEIQGREPQSPAVLPAGDTGEGARPEWHYGTVAEWQFYPFFAIPVSSTGQALNLPALP
jgi:hypothetical protein